MALLGGVYFFYTVPLAAVSGLVDPNRLDKIFPRFADWSKNSGLEVTVLVSGLVTALIWSTFFALCPVLFKVRR
jgi:hypothetical protein